ncbi:hypothetical protein Mterra_01906 [Calidithermus terrae]|uniref:Uncharacterized protein n=1 Tax=Calidithermus terrae TaxID=1408545 RepID=A0A399EM56_9DEIN|nr:hypothetical protein [Calidithermus terrae]RIH84726.1 hypothetical protein Mterra_01906 [Calidithermus terrae]
MRGGNLKHFVLGAALAASGLYVVAVSLPHTFAPGTPIKASEVNANFGALKTAADALESGKQTRVNGTCAAGSAIRAVNADGSVTCEAVSGGGDAGWKLTGNAGTNPASNFLGTADNQPLVFRTNNVERLRVDTGGNVGIGTASPGAKATVAVSEGSPALRLLSGSNAFLDVKPVGGTQTVLETVNNRDLVFSVGTGNVQVLRGVTSVPATLAGLEAYNFTAAGEAALLRTDSAANANAVLKLIKHKDSSGNFLECEAQGQARKCHINKDGTFVAGSDFAEALPALGDKADFSPGDVLVLSTQTPGRVERSSRPNDPRVAGVYSTRPGILGAEKGDGITRVDASDVPVAIVGIVPTKASAENGPIEVGDMLTTSSTPGHAMKASPVRVSGVAVYPGGILIGKALEPLREGTGLIRVLVTLR